MKNLFRSNKKGLSIIVSTIIITAIAITMAIAISFWAMGISNAFTKFEKLEIISMWVSDTTVIYQNRPCYMVSMQLKNTGTNTLTINNVFLDGKPYNTQYPPSRVPGGQLAYAVGLIGVSLQTGQMIGQNTSTAPRIYLPVGGMWNSGDFATVEIETAAGRHYTYTIVLP